MTIAAIRNLKGKSDFALSEEHVSILEERKEAYTTGKSKGKSWQAAHDNIRRQRKMVVA